MEKYNNWKLKFYTIWAGQAAVSYTHLDVYKRQMYPEWEDREDLLRPGWR